LSRPVSEQIGYLLESLPRSEGAFVTQEIAALQRHGFVIVPLVLRRRRPDAGPSGAGYWQHAIQAPAAFSLRCALSQVGALLRSPGGYLLALRLVVQRIARSPRQAPEMLASLWQAGYIATQMSRRIRHIHAHLAGTVATVAWLLATMTGRSYSFAIHAEELFAKAPTALGIKIAEAEFVVARSEYTRQRVLKRHRLVAEGKLHLIYRGVDPGDFEPVDHLRKGPPVIMSVGRLVEKKGFPYLLQSASILQSRGVDFRLVIVGDGPMHQYLVRMAGGLQLRDRVEFVGGASRAELRRLYEQADVFALPSVVAADGDRDGLAVVLLEVLAMGIPTVASKISAIPELIEHQKTGLLAQSGDPRDLADKLEVALYDEEVRGRLSLLGRRKIEKYFDANRNATALATLLTQVLRG